MALLVAFLWCPTSRAAGSSQTVAVGAPPPAITIDLCPIRVRVQNTTLGAVEVTVDGGKNWRLIGRVREPALEPSQDDAATAKGVGSVTRDAVRLILDRGRTISIVPPGKGATPRSVMMLGSPDSVSLIFEVLSCGRACLGLEVSGKAVPMYDGYTPSDGDVMLIGIVPLPDKNDAVTSLVEGAYRRYTETARQRQQASGRKPTCGYLTVVAKPLRDQQMGPVVFLLDGSPVAIINRPPYSVRWDTRDWTDGEHLVEVRALSPTGTIVTRNKALVFVQNRGEGG